MGKVKGQMEYEAWKAGKQLTMKKAILAYCYICNSFEQSTEDCLGEPSCPIYKFSPSGRKKGRHMVGILHPLKGKHVFSGRRMNDKSKKVVEVVPA